MKKYTLTFSEVSSPIVELVTKFGGQPVWVTEPQWPLSRMYGTPMQFICQIRLYPELFGALEAQMAYIFMTEWDWERSPETWEPEAGENAVILQPGTWTEPTLPLTEGPSLDKSVQVKGRWRRSRWQRVPCEYVVDLQTGEDPDELWSPWPVAWEIRRNFVRENKIGGFPVPTVNDEHFPYPYGGPWHLLLQLSSTDVPFHVNFGSDGNGYVLLSEDGHVGKFLWSR